MRNQYKRALTLVIEFLEMELEHQNYQDKDQHLDLIQQMRDWRDWITADDEFTDPLIETLEAIEMLVRGAREREEDRK